MEDCHHQSDFLFSNSCVACCFIMAEGQRWLFGLGGGCYRNVKSTGISLLGPKKRKENTAVKINLCTHHCGSAARVEEKPGNLNAGTFPAVTKSHSNENAARL